MIKTPYKKNIPVRKTPSRDQCSTHSSSKIKCCQEQNISKAIENFVCSTLKPILSSKKRITATNIRQKTAKIIKEQTVTQRNPEKPSKNKSEMEKNQSTITKKFIEHNLKTIKQKKAIDISPAKKTKRPV